MKDAADRTLGRMFVLRDVTDSIMGEHRSILTVSIICAVVSAVLVLLFSLFLGRVENGLAVLIASLKAEVVRRQTAESSLLEAHRELEDRVRARTQELQTAHGRLQRIMTNSPGMVFQFVRRADGSPTFPFVSAGSRTVFDLDQEYIQAHPTWLEDCIHPDDRAAFQASLSATQFWLWEGRVVLRDGRLRWIQTVAQLDHEESSGDVFWDGLMIDVTEQKQAAEAQLARAEAERANAAKSEFLSRMSHELRTPLNAVLGFGQVLALDDLSPTQEESVNYLLKGGRHLLGLINEVLDIAHVESGRLQLSIEPVELNCTFTETLALMRPVADAGNILLCDDTGSDFSHCVVADNQRLRQVLLNLVGNAIKYNRQGGSVTIKSRPLDSGAMEILVADTGWGIPKEKLDRLFIPFDRLGAEQTSVEGTGLGLALSRRLVEAMGGSLRVESTAGVGSTFTVTLPRASAAAKTNGIARDSMRVRLESTGERNVLYIEDNLSNLKLIQTLMNRWPRARLLSAMQAQLGLQFALDHQPDVILLDLHLPDLHGSEVLHRLKADPRTRSIPVIVLSADGTPGQGQRLVEAGARAFLTKPFDIHELIALIHESFGALALASAMNPAVLGSV